MRILAVLGLAGALAACGQQAANFDGRRALDLAARQVAFGPRIPGTLAHEQTVSWIASTLRDLGWQVEVQAFTYQGVSLTNLIARAGASGKAPILLGAHFDTRPMADRDPQSPRQPVPGADDGASGTAVLLELARVLKPQHLSRPVWLAFFDGEDSGFQRGWDWIVGSTYMAERLSIRPAAVVVVDMVGDSNLQLFEEANSDRALSDSIWGTAARLGCQGFIPQVKYTMIDDHTPFLKQGIRAVDIIDFDYPYWHTTADTPDKLSADSLGQVGRTLQAWIAEAGPALAEPPA